ncbi:MAG: hypothetical protein Q8P46_06420, partial [Hyphomicrobiales bacterium]|nr:hypothetical protein [Hyphomicrobiales bacterium]
MPRAPSLVMRGLDPRIHAVTARPDEGPMEWTAGSSPAVTCELGVRHPSPVVPDEQRPAPIVVPWPDRGTQEPPRQSFGTGVTGLPDQV